MPLSCTCIQQSFWCTTANSSASKYGIQEDRVLISLYFKPKQISRIPIMSEARFLRSCADCRKALEARFTLLPRCFSYAFSRNAARRSTGWPLSKLGYIHPDRVHQTFSLSCIQEVLPTHCTWWSGHRLQTWRVTASALLTENCYALRQEGGMHPVLRSWDTIYDTDLADRFIDPLLCHS